MAEPKDTRSSVFIDVRPLTHRGPYRALYVSQTASLLGTQMTAVAAPFQVYALSRSSLAVGMIGAAQLVPLIVCAFLGGLAADRFPRRQVLVATSVALCVLSALLTINAGLAHQPLWPVYLLIALSAGIGGIDLPTRRAVLPTLISKDLYPASSALSALNIQAAIIAGPVLAGVVIALGGARIAYLIDAVSFLIALLGLGLCGPIPSARADAAPPGAAPARGGTGWGEALRFLRWHRLLAACFGADALAMIFGMPRAAFPALATTVFHGGPHTLGLLYAATGVGAVVGATLSGWTARLTHPGHTVVYSMIVWGAAIAAAGASSWLILTLCLLAVAGAADIFSEVLRSTLLQLDVPDHLRGRVSALWIAQTTGSPRLGDAETGLVAAATTPGIAIITGGIAVIVTLGILLAAIPELWSWRRPTPITTEQDA